jgi:hypothetical protein
VDCCPWSHAIFSLSAAFYTAGAVLRAAKSPVELRRDGIGSHAAPLRRHSMPLQRTSLLHHGILCRCSGLRCCTTAFYAAAADFVPTAAKLPLVRVSQKTPQKKTGTSFRTSLQPSYRKIKFQKKILIRHYIPTEPESMVPQSPWFCCVRLSGITAYYAVVMESRTSRCSAAAYAAEQRTSYDGILCRCCSAARTSLLHHGSSAAVGLRCCTTAFYAVGLRNMPQSRCSA